MKDVETRSGESVVIDAVSKTYQTRNRASVVALAPSTLSIRDGEFVSILGPSGCGKTTLLNLIAGLLTPTSGSIAIHGSPVADQASIGYVFQRPVLLPWRRIIDNVLLPAEVLGLEPREEYAERARQLLTMIGLQGFENAYPAELSGGMQQRVAIARALAFDSPVLLMDEPFAALDAMTREDLNLELQRIWKATGRTMIFVTHNIPEAILLSDRIVVMTPRPGRILEVLDVDIPRPRSLSVMGHPRFGEIADHIRSLFPERHAGGEE
ncbi:ABC transporter ATP-binding protein [Mesorhizobium sp. CAU 1732]|uniref:ABC transporter ATP-binding protein n=1 Tax=Mesorhizobium sp. CAU 1732 TaxID=3140358 RepID=UPI003260BC07